MDVSRRRRWLVLLALASASSYGAYRVYNSKLVREKRRKLNRVVRTVVSVNDMVCDSMETFRVVCNDLKRFLQSDLDEIPRSLKQISKIAKSEEFLEPLASVSQGITLGILRGRQSEMSNDSGLAERSSFSDKVVDRMFSDAGSGFLSVIVGSFARNLVMGFYSEPSKNQLVFDLPDLGKWTDIVDEQGCKELLGNCIEKVVGTAVSVYLEKTMHINSYDEFFSGLTNPKHKNEARDILVSICNKAVESFVKTSHHVLTTCSNQADSQTCSEIGHPLDGACGGRWPGDVSSSLTDPNNRKFVLDVTGRVTFGTIRSVMEFMLWKLSSGLKRSFNVVQDDVVDKGLDVIKYVGTRSYLVVTICLALYLHVLGGNMVFLPS